MLKKLAILISIVAVVIAFRYSIGWAWIILSSISASFIFVYLAFHLRGLFSIKGLSPEARRMYKKLSFLYVIPQEDADFSEAADKMTWASIILAIVGCFQAYWWGLAFGLVNCLVMQYISRRFNLNNYLLEYKDVVANDEIMAHLQNQFYEEKPMQKKKEEQKAA